MVMNSAMNESADHFLYFLFSFDFDPFGDDGGQRKKRFEKTEGKKMEK